MELGKSGGRSSGNHPRPSARRRFTQLERIDPARVRDDVWIYSEHGQTRHILRWISAGVLALIMLAVLIAIVGRIT